MVRSSENKQPPQQSLPKIKVPDPDRQIRFHQQLVIARSVWLSEALRTAVTKVDPLQLKHELIQYVPTTVQSVLAAAGIRDEYVFPTPVLLATQPRLVGYYRLLLGIPQKSFYRSDSGLVLFRSMEVSGKMNAVQQAALPYFCEAMGRALAQLMTAMTPTITQRDVGELPLLTLGAQFQGSNNNKLGQAAISGVFSAIGTIIQNYILRPNPSRIEVLMSTGQAFVIALANDPDIRIQEQKNSSLDNILAIEVKGGTDQSNVYNRGGEAEKSHQTARKNGYKHCWTLINMHGCNIAKLKGGSPSTDRWFEISHILTGSGTDWNEFQYCIRSLLAADRE